MAATHSEGKKIGYRTLRAWHFSFIDRPGIIIMKKPVQG